MWSRGRDEEQPGKFAYELFDGRNLVERVGGFATHTEADRAAESAQRRLLLGAPIECSLSDADLLAELLA